MKRRNFLLSLFGLAAAPAVAKVGLLLPAPVTFPAAPDWIGVDMAPIGAVDMTVINLRDAAMRDLSRWFAERVDYATLAVVMSPGQIAAIEADSEWRRV